MSKKKPAYKVATPDINVSKALPALAGGLDKALEQIAGQRMSFCLVVFNSEAGSRTNYVSNVDRAAVIETIEILLKGWKEGMPDIPAHEFKG